MLSIISKRGGFRRAIKKIVHIKADKEAISPNGNSSMKYVNASISPTIQVTTSILEAGNSPIDVVDTCNGISWQAAAVVSSTIQVAASILRAGNSSIDVEDTHRNISRRTSSGLTEDNTSKEKDDNKDNIITETAKSEDVNIRHRAFMEDIITDTAVTKSEDIKIRQRAFMDDIILDSGYANSEDVPHLCHYGSRDRFSQLIVDIFKTVFAIFLFLLFKIGLNFISMSLEFICSILNP